MNELALIFDSNQMEYDYYFIWCP